MKKTLKAVIASILVISMLFCSVSASAVSFLPADSDLNDSVLNATFAPAETGYYCSETTISQDGQNLFSIPSKYGDSEVFLYYLEKGEVYDINSDASPEFIDAEIDRVSVTDHLAFDNLILGIDVEEGDTFFFVNTSVGIVFPNNKLFSTLYDVRLSCEEGIVAGENEVKFDFPGYDGESFTLTACNLDDIIKTVELKNASSATTAYIDYKDTVFFNNLDNTVVIINGTQEIVANEYGYFVYYSRNYPIYVDFEVSEDAPVKLKVYLDGVCGSVEIASFDCKVYEASNSQNAQRAIYHYQTELAVLVNELVDKYSSWPSYLISLTLPIMMAEYWAKAIPLMFEFFSDYMDFVLKIYNF